MFENTVPEMRAGLPWGLVGGLAAFVVLLVIGYVLVT